MAAIQYLYQDHQDSPDNQQLVNQAMELARYLCSECLMSFRPGFARGMLRYLARGFESDLLRAVIGVTAKAPYPSWAYFASIMARAEQDRAYCLRDFDLYRVRSRRLSAQQYTQREYTEADLLAVSDDLISEARRLRDKPDEGAGVGSRSREKE
jgi:hypothetical protein